MAKARRNIKTHPKPTGDGAPPDDYLPPDRADVLNAGLDSGRSEVVDVFGKETVDTGAGADDRVDLDSAAEGDGRSMASEGGGDAGELDDGNGPGNPRMARGARAPRDRAAGNGDREPEDSGYSASVRKRIARERTLVNRERTLREQTQRELTEERTARQAQDERIARLERQQTEITGNSGVKDLEAQIAALKPQLAAAMEAGETAKALDLQDKLGDLKAKIEVLKYDLRQKQTAAEAAAANRGRQQQQTDTSAVIDDPRVAELAAQFWKSNRHWANRTANKAAAQDMVTIDKEILVDIQAGDLDFEPYSDEHFEEVGRRLHETYPDLEIQDLEGQPYNFDGEEEDMNDSQGRRNGGNNASPTGGQRPQKSSRGSAPVGRMGQNGRRAPSEVDLARSGKVTLDEHDFATMRTFKMDPSNANDKKYFAREKMRSILSGARQQNGGNRS